MFCGVRFKAWTIDDGIVCFEVIHFRQRGAAQHRAVEQGMPCEFAHHTHVKTVGRIGAAVEIFDEIIATFHMLDHVRVKDVKLVRFHRLVVFPPDCVFNARCADHIFVVGRAPRMLACGDIE